MGWSFSWQDTWGWEDIQAVSTSRPADWSAHGAQVGDRLVHRLGRGDDELKAEVPLKTGPCHSDPACAGNGGPGLSDNVFPPPQRNQEMRIL